MVATSRGRESPIRIQLDRNGHAYAPEQQCSGRVLVAIMKSAVDSTVSISLVGRVRTVVSSANGQLESHFENIRNFIEVTDTLCEGHYIRQSGEIVYVFNLVVPTHMEESVDQPELSEDSESPAPFINALVPSSTRFTDSVIGRSWSAEIEYVLVARVVSPVSQTNTATLPITVWAGPSHPPLDLYDPSQRITATEETSIRSWTLLPESQHSPRTLRQRTASLFRSPSLPLFTFEVEVSYPRVLQLGNPQTMPFIVAVSAVTGVDKTSIVPNAVSSYQYPSVTIESVKVDLHTKTTINYPTLTKTASMTKLSRFTILHRDYLGHRLVVPSLASHQRTEPVDEDASTVDIGKFCDMTLPLQRPGSASRSGDTTAKAVIHDALSASFASPTLTHEYALSWSIAVVCTNERCKIRSKTPQPIQVIEGPLPTGTLGQHSIPLGPAPAYSKYAQPSWASSATEDSFRARTGSTGVAASASVQHIMQVSKAATEAALCELPAYTEPIGDSSVRTSWEESLLASQAGSKKTLKPLKR